MFNPSRGRVLVFFVDLSTHTYLWENLAFLYLEVFVIDPFTLFCHSVSGIDTQDQRRSENLINFTRWFGRGRLLKTKNSLMNIIIFLTLGTSNYKL